MSFPGVWKPTNDVTFSEEPFFEDEPFKLLEEGKVLKVPLMTG